MHAALQKKKKKDWTIRKMTGVRSVEYMLARRGVAWTVGGCADDVLVVVDEGGMQARKGKWITWMERCKMFYRLSVYICVQCNYTGGKLQPVCTVAAVMERVGFSPMC